VAELAIRTIDCGIVAMAAPGYGRPSLMMQGYATSNVERLQFLFGVNS